MTGNNSTTVKNFQIFLQVVSYLLLRFKSLLSLTFIQFVLEFPLDFELRPLANIMAVPSQCTDKLRSCILERHFPTVCSELLVTGQIEFFYFIPVLKGPGTVVFLKEHYRQDYCVAGIKRQRCSPIAHKLCYHLNRTIKFISF